MGCSCLQQGRDVVRWPSAPALRQKRTAQPRKSRAAITFGSYFGLKCFISLSLRWLRSQPDHLWQDALKFSPAQPAGVLESCLGPAHRFPYFVLPKPQDVVKLLSKFEGMARGLKVGPVPS